MKEIIFLAVLLFSNAASAQWELVHDFGGLNTFIRSTYFLHEQGAPNVGFVGLGDKSTGVGRLLRTLDAGKTWTQVGQFEEFINEIYFKNRDTGWIVTFARDNTSGGCYQTSNGGSDWNFVQGTRGPCSAIEYIHDNNQLLVSRWGMPSIQSADLGANWREFGGSNNGFAFISPEVGIASTVRSWSPLYSLTTDGGATWGTSPIDIECWQPIAIPKENLLLVLQEPREGDIFASTDQGVSWQRRGNIGDKLRVSGQLSYDGCLLYTQSFTLGISVSSDLGYTWQHLGGPGADSDTRLFLYENTMYAGDLKARLWVNHNKAYPANRLAVGSNELSRTETEVTLSMPSPWPFHSDGLVDTDTAIFELEYNSDELQLLSAVPSLNRGLKRKTVLSPSSTEYVVHRIDRTLRQDTEIIAFKFRSNVSSKGIGGYVRISNVRFDSLSPGVECMRQDAPIDSIYVGVPQCGDSILAHYLANGIKAIEIKSINPNPTSGNIIIEWDARVAGVVKLEVYSVAGVLVHEEFVALASAGKPLTLDTRPWPSGAYTIVLRSGDEEASASLIKQ